MIRAAGSPKEGRHDAPHECPRVAWSSKRRAGLQAKGSVWDNAAARRWYGIPPRAQNQSNWSPAVENTHLICGQPSCVLAMLSMPDGRRFSEGFSPISGSVFRRQPAKNKSKKNACFCSFWVKKHGVAFPEVIEKTCSVVATWRQVEERRRRRSSALDKLCSRIINAMRFACRPDTHYAMSSTGQCCDQDCRQHHTNQTKQKIVH